jgi:hypothetical protein
MNHLQRLGAISAWAAAATFVAGFWLYFSLLTPAGYGSLKIDAVKHAAFLVDNHTTMYAWNLIIYVVFGILLVVLALALHERLKACSPALMQPATIFGLIWATLVIASGMVANIGADVVAGLYARDPAQAAAAWITLSMVVNGLGGGNEIVGGIWLLLVSLAALQPHGLPKALGYLGLIVSVAGLLTTIPPLKELGAVFGLGLIAWFVWVGCVLLRRW